MATGYWTGKDGKKYPYGDQEISAPQRQQREAPIVGPGGTEDAVRRQQDLNRAYQQGNQQGNQQYQNALNQANQQYQYGQSGAGYQGLQGVSGQTSGRLGGAQSGYQPSAAVQQAQQALASLQNSKPGAYNSQYSQQLDTILQQITNPGKFNYEFNGDELFKQYADQYTQRGRQASMDAMGQAAALTGGYGNSYAQMVGNQAYQQNLTELYDRGLELRDRAYQQYRDELGDKATAYGLLSDAESREYDRYRDAFNDWLNERDYLTGRADTLDEREYGRWANDLDYWTNLAQTENADYWTRTNYNEDVRRYDQDFAENQRRYDQDFAEDVRRNNRDYDEDVRRNNRDYDEDVRRNNRDYDEDVRRNDRDYEEDRRRYDQDFAESRRINDRNYDEDKRRYDQDYAEDQRRYDQDREDSIRSEDRKYAYNYVMSVIENNQIPTAELLVQAGLSEEDARRMIKALQTVNGPGSRTDPEEKEEKSGPCPEESFAVESRVYAEKPDDGPGRIGTPSAGQAMYAV
jgi:hypothetical protein